MEPQFKALVKKAYRGRDIADLLDAAEAVQQILDSPGWQAIMALLDAERDAVAATMAVKVLDQADYAHRHGYIAGLSAPVGAASALVEHAAAELDRQQQAAELVSAQEPGR